MTITIQKLGETVRCDQCGSAVGILYGGELHIRAGKQVMIGRDVRVTCPGCGHLHFFGVTDKGAGNSCPPPQGFGSKPAHVFRPVRSAATTRLPHTA